MVLQVFTKDVQVCYQYLDMVCIFKNMTVFLSKVDFEKFQNINLILDFRVYMNQNISM